MSDLDELERRAQRGGRAAAALSAASAILDEEHESAIAHYMRKHEGGNMTHDDYVRFAEKLATLRRLKSNLERHREDGERARATMAGEQT